LLLLPDFYQSGEINVWGDGMSLPMPVSIYKDIPLRELPDCFILGIPESLLRANVEQDFVYAQYARLNSKQSILSFSIRGGHDKSGRTVVLTILQLLGEGESLTFPPESPLSLPFSIDKRNEIEGRAEAMIKLLQSDPPANIKNMILAVGQYPKLQSFASEDTDSLAQRPQWTPHKKKEYRFVIGIFVAFLLLAFLIIAS
jgi:hypothetical protein